MTEHTLVNPHIKRAIYERQNRLCAYCGDYRAFRTMTVDHIIPISKGGADEPENMQCVCKKCNGMKSDMLPTEFSRYIHGIFLNNLKCCELELQRTN